MMDFAYSLSISLITNSLKEVTVFSNEDVTEVLKNPRLRGHTLLLVSNEDIENIFFNERYVGILDRSNCTNTGKVKDCGLMPIIGKYIEEDTPILDFVKLNIPYAFVVDLDGIRGFLTEYDLDNSTVHVLAFILVTHLEYLLRKIIQVHITDEQTLQRFISWKNLRRYQNDRSRSIEKPLVEYAELWEEIEAIKAINIISEDDAQELHAIRELRNALGHGHSFIQDFIPRLRRTIKWTDQLGNFSLAL